MTGLPFWSEHEPAPVTIGLGYGQPQLLQLLPLPPLFLPLPLFGLGSCGAQLPPLAP